jgi:hypothetical protein
MATASASGAAKEEVVSKASLLLSRRMATYGGSGTWKVGVSGRGEAEDGMREGCRYKVRF